MTEPTEPKKKCASAGWRARRRGAAILQYTDRHGVVRTATGRKFTVDGVLVELFPSSTLTKILWRSPKCLYTWEAKFGFPTPMWVVAEDKKRKRWYSRKQLDAILATYKKLNRLQGKSRNDLRKFILAVCTFFYTLDAPIKERPHAQAQIISPETPSNSPGGNLQKG